MKEEPWPGEVSSGTGDDGFGGGDNEPGILRRLEGLGVDVLFRGDEVNVPIVGELALFPEPGGDPRQPLQIGLDASGKPAPVLQPAGPRHRAT